MLSTRILWPRAGDQAQGDGSALLTLPSVATVPKWHLFAGDSPCFTVSYLLWDTPSSTGNGENYKKKKGWMSEKSRVDILVA